MSFKTLEEVAQFLGYNKDGTLAEQKKYRYFEIGFKAAILVIKQSDDPTIVDTLYTTHFRSN